jgi:hypothetical protein
LNELVESDDGGLFEAVHATPDFEIYIAVGGNLDVIARVVPDFLCAAELACTGSRPWVGRGSSF